MENGFEQGTTFIAAEAALEGARLLLGIHGASPERLQIEFKAEAGMTPRTVADLRSGEAMKRIIRISAPEDAINEEESGFEEGTGCTWHVDPLDGTSSYAAGQRYSTIGVAVHKADRAQSVVILHPFELELLVAEAGKGAFLFPLKREDRAWGQAIFLTFSDPSLPMRLRLPAEASLAGGCVYLDALFNGKTASRKLDLMGRLTELSGDNLGFRMTGSNIDQQRQVAAGRGQLTITDAVGGFYDLAAGALILREAGGKMVDGQTGGPVTEQTQVAIGGPSGLVDQVLPIVQECYRGYAGFK
ncbi:MAG: hypothetical protein A2700_00595 [Candidatus Blackburnbacteria bacterium RIFCSPHIGHO2_01_FULL_44_64]|nr:MAG: hypothetical protein A2700_00595 [Candidatus Blackburnbacteria bacterium RIFCSPHIGHO2_01_FULL_44_64]OGY17461.1 MAG: hypothetical protein A3H88_03695 [Candidatus Blackburnbacteria bacterium RIFCSPLOWO2_02_FULL_44_9]